MTSTWPLAILLAGFLVAPDETPAAHAADGVGIHWEKSFKDAMKKAREENRPVLVDFWAEWCHWCHELDATTYRDPGVVASAGPFVPVKVNTEGSLGEKQISADYGIEILPTIAFLSPGGHMVLFREQFEGPEAFVKTLETARTKAAEVGAWEAALGRDGNDPATLAQLGAHLVSQKQLDEGRDLLERAAKHDAGRPAGERKRTRMALADIKAGAGRFADAEKLLQGALAIEPPDSADDAEALLRLGEAYLQLGKAEPARAAWTKAVATAPDGPAADRARKDLANRQP
jgi:thiol-disulfide isomerase/thioredoxin